MITTKYITTTNCDNCGADLSDEQYLWIGGGENELFIGGQMHETLHFCDRKCMIVWIENNVNEVP